MNVSRRNNEKVIIIGYKTTILNKNNYMVCHFTRWVIALSTPIFVCRDRITIVIFHVLHYKRLLSRVIIIIILMIRLSLLYFLKFDLFETPCNSIALQLYESMASGLRPEHGNNKYICG